MSKHQGFSVIALIIIIAVLAVGGYAMWQKQLGSEASKSAPAPITNISNNQSLESTKTVQIEETQGK